MLETPALNSHLLTAASVALIGAYRVDLGMSAHIPAIVACEIAVSCSVSDVRVASDETRSWLTVLVGLLVSDVR